MSLKNKFFSVLTVVSGVLVLSSMTIAQDTTAPAPVSEKTENHARGGCDRNQGLTHGRTPGIRNGHRGIGGGFRGIDLTDAQKAQIKSIRESNKPNEATIEEFRSMHDARKAGTTITQEQKDRMKSMHEQMQAKAKLVHEQVFAVLTAEQKAQIESRKSEMRQRFDERRQTRKQKPSATDKPVIN